MYIFTKLIIQPIEEFQRTYRKFTFAECNVENSHYNSHNQYIHMDWNIGNSLSFQNTLYSYVNCKYHSYNTFYWYKNIQMQYTQQKCLVGGGE